jgi:hypothetical protein
MQNEREKMNIRDIEYRRDVILENTKGNLDKRGAGSYKCEMKYINYILNLRNHLRETVIMTKEECKDPDHSFVCHCNSMGAVEKLLTQHFA